MSRVWLVTGASSGFGRAIAEAALGAGDTVVGAARRPEALAGAYPGRVDPVRLDVTESGAAAAVVDDVAVGQEVDFGVRFLLVEPGAFRTGLFNPGAAYLSAELPEYAATVGPTRQYVTGGDGGQPGDPAKAAAAVLTALDAEQPPLRLALGGDAVDSIRTELDARSAELATWEQLARNTAFGPE